MKRVLPLGVALAILNCPRASARVVADQVYQFDQVWSAAVRLLRVDLGLAIRERNHEDGFLLFDYVERDHPYPGSVELFHVQEHGQEGVRVVVTIPNMPRYVEQVIINRLERKLRDEFGEPPPRPKPTKEPEGDSPSAPRAREEEAAPTKARQKPSQPPSN